ncbi:hypothetical protein [Sorangium sp. So ce341]|uniref:hypothetical protein n=1 Tax=Sorangium sp. So ce341 TaxID=3133302 RepID=UPI003F612811
MRVENGREQALAVPRAHGERVEPRDPFGDRGQVDLGQGRLGHRRRLSLTASASRAILNRDAAVLGFMPRAFAHATKVSRCVDDQERLKLPVRQLCQHLQDLARGDLRLQRRAERLRQHAERLRVEHGALDPRALEVVGSLPPGDAVQPIQPGLAPVVVNFAQREST